MKSIDIKKYGFTDQFAAQANLYPEQYAGRVISQSKNIYQIISESGELRGEISGKFRFEAKVLSDFPAVGDFVMIDRNSDKNGNVIIHHVLPRKSAFIRKAAGTANEEQICAMIYQKNYLLPNLLRWEP